MLSLAAKTNELVDRVTPYVDGAVENAFGDVVTER